MSCNNLFLCSVKIYFFLLFIKYNWNKNNFYKTINTYIILSSKKRKNLYIFLISCQSKNHVNQKIKINHLYKKYNIVLKKLKLKNCNKIFQYIFQII